MLASLCSLDLMILVLRPCAADASFLALNASKDTHRVSLSLHDFARSTLMTLPSASIYLRLDFIPVTSLAFVTSLSGLRFWGLLLRWGSHLLGLPDPNSPNEPHRGRERLF